MATGNKVPERLINFRVYNDGNDLLGVANVDLPSIEAMSDTVSGAGIAGEVESPILGHFGSMTATFTWRTITPELAKLANQKAHALDLRGSQQVYDAALGEYSSVPVRVSLRATPKSISRRIVRGRFYHGQRNRVRGDLHEGPCEWQGTHRNRQVQLHRQV